MRLNNIAYCALAYFYIYLLFYWTMDHFNVFTNIPGIVVAFRLLSNPGSISEAVGSGATVTAKRGFPDIIMPGDVRNDLYLTLEKAEFERGGKSTAKNVLATVSVHDISGSIIQVSIY